MSEHRNNSLGFTISDDYRSSRQRREAMKCERQRDAIHNSFVIIICLMLFACSLVTLYLIAANIVPLLGGMTVLAGMIAMIWLQLRSIRNN